MLSLSILLNQWIWDLLHVLLLLGDPALLVMLPDLGLPVMVPVPRPQLLLPTNSILNVDRVNLHAVVNNKK
jgi:hypothetical protein